MRTLALVAAFLSGSIGLAQAQLAQSGQATGTGYPAGATVLMSNANGANTSSIAAVLPNSPGKLTFVCGFQASGLGATALTNVQINVVAVGSSTTSGNFSWAYQFPAGVTAIATPVNINFTPCLPASATNASLAFLFNGAAGNTYSNINVWGYWMNSP